MAGAATISGPRVQVWMDGELQGTSNAVSWGWNYDIRNIDLLGRFSTAETVLTGAEPVELTLGGYRVFNAGPHVTCKVPRLQDLMTSDYFELILLDRQTNQPIGKVHQCRAYGYAESADAKSIMTMTIHVRGLLLGDESGENVESSGATVLPPAQ